MGITLMVKNLFHLFKDELGNSTIKKVTKIYREKI
jgi:hypothetical protein